MRAPAGVAQLWRLTFSGNVRRLESTPIQPPTTPRANPLMQYPPTTQLLQDRALLLPTGILRAHFPFTRRRKERLEAKGEIAQFDFESLLSLQVGNEQAAMRFGARHAPFCPPKPNNTSQKSKITVHVQKNMAVIQDDVYF